MTSDAPYVIARAGEHPKTWHIPGPPGMTLCGIPLGPDAERRYLPSLVPAGDENCERCLAVYRDREHELKGGESAKMA